MQELRDRVEALEVASSITSANTEVLIEFLKILTEVPVGKQFFNRALNRQKLNKLKEIVLPRRRSQLIEIMAEHMPDPIRENFVNEEMKLLRQVIRSISHREHYELKSAGNLRSFLTSFFKKAHDVRVRKLIDPYYSSHNKHYQLRQLKHQPGR